MLSTTAVISFFNLSSSSSLVSLKASVLIFSIIWMNILLFMLSKGSSFIAGRFFFCFWPLSSAVIMSFQSFMIKTSAMNSGAQRNENSSNGNYPKGD
jgi:hypothetical protein